MDAEFWTAVAAAAAAISAALAAMAAWQSRQQLATAEKGAEAAVILEINKAWNVIYPDYRALLQDPVDYTSVIKQGTKFNSYATTVEWRRLRPIFAFYEFLGAAIRTGYVKEPVLFSLVTVDVALWETYRPLILHFRTERPDLYTAWQHLAERRRLYKAGAEHMPLKRSGLLSRIFGRG